MTGFTKQHASIGLQRIMETYNAATWEPYGDGNARLLDEHGEVIRIVPSYAIREWGKDDDE
jgi:hypothetical protein